MKKPQSSLSRRDFLKVSSALAGFSILPSHIWASSPNAKLQIAQIGVGGRGSGNLDSLLALSNMDIVGICDVDRNNLETAAALVPRARTFRDYRELLDKLDKSIDAVLVSTPDHMHGPIALEALKRGKHVYCEKPLAHNVAENRKLNEESKKRRLVTQLGIQVSSSIGQRMTVEYIRSGLIGKVSEVHVWSNKKWGRDELTLPSVASPIPETLDWELWLGVAGVRPYLDGYYHPAQWRKMIDFGTGTLGDMGVHIFDTPYRALKLTAPKWAKTTCRQPNGFSHPVSNQVEYSFAATRYTAKHLKWVWYDGDNAPPTDIPGFTLTEGTEMPKQGCIFIGEKGNLMMPHMNAPQTFPPELIRSVPKPQLEPMDHHGNWVDACLGKGKTISPFSYGAPLCEALQLGVVAGRFPGRELMWNARSMKVTNIKEANAFIDRKYRVY